MVRNKGKLYVLGERKLTETKGKLEDDVEALFRLPLAEFTAARNTLAAQLKKAARGDDAVLVKALVKPSISAWAVNQLYWNHREAFDRLIASGEQFHKAQSSRLGGKLTDMRTALDARREALTHLSELATSLLRDAGHNPTPDTTRRITSTLEAISAISVDASRSDAPRPGRLTHDVDPPGFEAFGSFIPGAGMSGLPKEPSRFTPSQKSSRAATNTRRRVAPERQVHQVEETRKAGIAAAKVALQDAKRVLIEARARAQSLQAAQKKAEAEAKEAEKQSRQAEERWEKARATSEAAAQRVRSVAVEVEEAAKSMQDAKRTVEKASEEIEKLFRESPAS